MRRRTRACRQDTPSRAQPARTGETRTRETVQNVSSPQEVRLSLLPMPWRGRRVRISKAAVGREGSEGSERSAAGRWRRRRERRRRSAQLACRPHPGMWHVAQRITHTCRAPQPTKRTVFCLQQGGLPHCGLLSCCLGADLNRECAGARAGQLGGAAQEGWQASGEGGALHSRWALGQAAGGCTGRAGRTGDRRSGDGRIRRLNCRAALVPAACGAGSPAAAAYKPPERPRIALLKLRGVGAHLRAQERRHDDP